MAEVDWVTDKSEQVGRRNENGLSAGLKYAGNRFTASLQHDRLFHGLGSEKLDIRSSATVSTAIAVADGRWGWGRPVGGAFAIIGLDPAVTGGRLDIAPTAEGAQARADFFGPALISGLTAYTANTITVAPDDLPADYDLGDGAFILQPSYKSGYALTAGAAGRISVQGRLVDKDGRPVALAMGKARRPENGDEKGQAFFTTEDGRFFVSGLQPGLWHLSLKGRPDTRFVVNVPDKKKRIIDVGDVPPED
jgi:outer membrane usher protein FimD/PapC